MAFVELLISKHPDLKKKLRIAKIDSTPKKYVKKSLKNSIMTGLMFGMIAFFLMSKNEPHFLIPFLVAVVCIFLFYQFNFKKIDVKISKRAKEIDKSVLFAGRFLLIKLNSGDPLINAIEEAGKSYGAASEYFKDILKQVQLGTDLETALARATEYCPSKYLKQILFQITNALRIGIDVTHFLESTLEEISDEQLIEIMRYGKKLSSLSMFYMLVAVIVPSLGMTLFMVVASMISINMDFFAFSIIIFFLALIQFIFITLFKSARPNMEV